MTGRQDFALPFFAIASIEFERIREQVSRKFYQKFKVEVAGRIGVRLAMPMQPKTQLNSNWVSICQLAKKGNDKADF